MIDHPVNLSLETLDLNIWERAIKPLLTQLTESDKSNLSDSDLFAWLLQQHGRLKRGEIEKAEISVIVAIFMDQALELLSEGRYQLRELMKTLLILCSSPTVNSRQRPSALDEVQNHRWFIQTLLRDNPSITLILHDMIRFAWRGARTGAVHTLSIRHDHVYWERQLPEDCPWTVPQILAYDPFDKDDYLLHSKTLPPQRFFPDLPSSGSPHSAINR